MEADDAHITYVMVETDECDEFVLQPDMIESIEGIMTNQPKILIKGRESMPADFGEFVGTGLVFEKPSMEVENQLETNYRVRIFKKLSAVGDKNKQAQMEVSDNEQQVDDL